MALFGISLLIASITFVVYRTRSPAWSSILKRFKGPPQPPGKVGEVREPDAQGHATEKEDAPPQEEDKGGDENNVFREGQRDVPMEPHKESRTRPSKPEIERQPDSRPPQSTPAQPPPTIPNTTTAQSSETKAQKPPPSQLMPPPPRPTPTNPRRTPQLSSSLRPPPTGLLPNRLPPPRSSTASLSLSATRPLPTTPNPRAKVLLKPGHSPLDWAALTRSGTNLSGVPHFQRVTPADLKARDGRKGRQAWSVYRGKVYNVTPYLPFHPGGEGELLRGAGRDGEKAFMEAHPWVNWENMLGECLVGFLVDGGREGGAGLDEMD